MTENEEKGAAKVLVRHVLLIEDSPVDAKVTAAVCAKANIQNQVATVTNGEEALDYLNHRGSYEDEQKHPVPELILADINMPGMSGHEFLEKVRAEKKFRDIPVIMLTASEDEKDVAESLSRGADGYLKKPLPGRTNIIISRAGFKTEHNAPVYPDIESAIYFAKSIAKQENQNEIFIMGGAQIYTQSLQHADRIHLTKIHETIEGDTLFPEINEKEWKETTRTDHKDKTPPYSFITLERST